MHSTEWRELLARVPQKQHNKLVLMTTVGFEIMVQDLLRMEPEYLVIRGRLGGTSDAGRLFFVPFDQISYVGIAKLIQENEIEEIFGTSAPTILLRQPSVPKVDSVVKEHPTTPAVTPEEQNPSETAPEESEGIPVPIMEEETTDPTPQTAATPTKFPNRAELLERIRSRSQQGSGLRPPQKPGS